MITWAELKSEVIDLGFEEPDVIDTDTYGSIIVNACNRAIRRIYTAYIPIFEERLESIPAREAITKATEDDAEITIPEEFEGIIGLIAAHYMWLDDDIQKATMYWNEADAMLQELANALNRPKECKYVGGW